MNSVSREGILQFFLYEQIIEVCDDFGWGRLNFLHSSWYGAIFWICAGNSVGNTEMFSLLLSSACIVKVFSASHTTPPARKMEVHTKWGGETAGTADPN